MRILVYGAGVIGSIFAAKLSLTGSDVTVLARNRRYKEIKDTGIIIRNPGTNQVERAKVQVITTLDAKDQYDYILVVMQNKQVNEVLPVLKANVSRNIVFVVNTAAGYDKWVEAVGKERLMIGFPSAGGERKNGEVWYFVGSGLQRAFQTTTFGDCYDMNSQRLKELVHLFRKAHIPTVSCTNMDAWQKTHVAMVTSIGNALYAYDCDNRALGRSYQDVKDMVIGIKEGRTVLRKCGIKPTPGKLWWFDLPTGILSICFTLFMRSQLAEITMAKHCSVARNEMIALQAEFDLLIERSGVATPTIDKLRKNLLKQPKENI